MSAPRRPAFLPALAIVLIAGVVAACGVKGALEAPPAAPESTAEKLSAQPEAAPDVTLAESANKKVFVEQSRVQGGNSRDILPQMPPKEWSKPRVYQPAQGKKSSDGAEASKSKPDRPFALDWLL